jgi:hypothetical protein
LAALANGTASPTVVSLAEEVLRSLAACTIKLVVGGIVIIAALGFALGHGKIPAGRGHEQTETPSLHASTAGWKARLALFDAALPRKANVSTRASDSWDEHSPDRAFDGGRNTMWNAGDYAPQWIEADLGSLTQLASIRLVIAQMPAGHTTHEIWVSDEPIGANRAKTKLAHTFRGHTDQGEQLSLDFPKELFARHVQIRTIQSPSWVAWAEIELRVERPDGQYLCWSDRTERDQLAVDSKRHQLALPPPGTNLLPTLRNPRSEYESPR